MRNNNIVCKFCKVKNRQYVCRYFGTSGEDQDSICGNLSQSNSSEPRGQEHCPIQCHTQRKGRPDARSEHKRLHPDRSSHQKRSGNHNR